jgi:hypothetical protein
MKKKMVLLLAIGFSFALMFGALSQSPGVISTQGYIGGA